MDQKQKKQMRGAFFYLDENGEPSDAGLHESMLRDEDRIRQELIDAGIIKNIVLERKKPNNKK